MVVALDGDINVAFLFTDLQPGGNAPMAGMVVGRRHTDRPLSFHRLPDLDHRFIHGDQLDTGLLSRL